MSLKEEFEKASLTPGASVIAFVRIMAAEMDKLGKAIAAFPDAPEALPADTRSWAKSIASANGYGDILNNLRAMAERIDELQEWTTEHVAPVKLSVVDRMAKARAARKAA